MAFKCHMGWCVSILVGALLVSQTFAKTFRFDFESDLEQWASKRGKWHWASPDTLSNTLPASYDNGFAVMESSFDSDELYTPKFSVPNGAIFTIAFYIRSEYVGSNSLLVDLVDETGNINHFLDLSSYSTPDTKEWFTVSKAISPTDKQINMDIFCYNGPQAPIGAPLRGCAIDHIIFETFEPTQPPPTDTTPISTAAQTTDAPTTEAPTTDAPTTETRATEAPTTEPPTTEAPTTDVPTTEAPTTEAPTTEAPTTEAPTTEAPTTEAPPTEASTFEVPTTEAPTTEALTTEAPTTEAPTTEVSTTEAPTTEAPTTEVPTTEVPTTEVPTTEAPATNPPTTEEPTTEVTTTEAPTTETLTTEAPTTEANFDTTTESYVTTQAPNTHQIYDFQSSTNGWSLSLMNGASWKRVPFQSEERPVGPPPFGEYALEVFPELVQIGQVKAQSPELEVAAEQVKVTVFFWMDGTFDFPARLQLRRRFDFSTFDPTPVLDLSPYGEQQNQQWLKYSGYIANPKLGEQFSLALEGSLGGDPNNSVVVHRIEVEGAKEVYSDPSNFFSFEKGLSGWSPGSMNGGRWILMNWNDTDPALNIPEPPNGDRFLMVERYDIYSGIISLESPRLELPPGYIRRLQLKFWIRASVTYPVALRFRVKGNEGDYDKLPFLNLEHYGDTDNLQWTQLEKLYNIPSENTDKYFQLVIEADLGGDMKNLVGVDDIKIISEKIDYI